MKAIHRPHTLMELAMVRSLLAAHDIPYYVHNAGYASLYPGMQIELLNVPTVMVPQQLVESAKELLEAYLPDIQEHQHPSPDVSWRDFFRMLAEGMICAWFVPRIGRGRNISAEPDDAGDPGEP